MILRVYPDRTVDALTTSSAKRVVFKEMEVYDGYVQELSLSKRFFSAA